MLDINRGVVEDLQSITRNPIGDIADHFNVSRNTVNLLGGASSPLAEFSSEGVKVGRSKLILPTQVSDVVGERSFSVYQILSMLNTDEISLNHLGLRYRVFNLDQEQNRIQRLLQNDCYTIYEDPTGRLEGMRWLFVGLPDPQNEGKPRTDLPMFEIVLVQEDSGIHPHIQFDVDTKLEYDDILAKIKRGMRLTEGEKEFYWELDIPNKGKILSMGTYNDLDGLHHDIGIGNKKRNKIDHRNSMKALI